MTTIDRTGASDAEFEARIAPFEAVERVALAMYRHDTGATASDVAILEFVGPYIALAEVAIAALDPS